MNLAWKCSLQEFAVILYTELESIWSPLCGPLKQLNKYVLYSIYCRMYVTESKKPGQSHSGSVTLKQEQNNFRAHSLQSQSHSILCSVNQMLKFSFALQLGWRSECSGWMLQMNTYWYIQFIRPIQHCGWGVASQTMKPVCHPDFSLIECLWKYIIIWNGYLVWVHKQWYANG